MMSEILLAVGTPIAAVFAAGLSAMLLPPESALARDLGLADRVAPSAQGISELSPFREALPLEMSIREAA